MSKRPIVLLLFSIVSLVLTACNLPTRATPTEDPNAVFTAAAQTVEAQLTQAAALASPTQPTLATLPPSTQTVVTPTFTLKPPTPTNTPICDLGQYVKDISVPDGTVFAPGTAFTKTWRIKNIGVCEWSGYSLVFDSGDAMSGDASKAIGSVLPGQEVDLSIDLKAPSTEGTYRGYWRIRNASGVLIPIAGGYQGRSFYVEIKVANPTATPTNTPPSNVTVNINPTGGNTGGTVYDPASGIALVQGTILAGDTSSNYLARGFMSFDISALSGKTIVSADLKLNMCSAMNNPFTDLAGIWVGEVQFTPPLDQPHYSLSGTGIELLSAAPSSNINVKNYVQTRVNEGKTYFQIRLHPSAGASDGDGAADYMSCGATGPVLTIVYQP